MARSVEFTSTCCPCGVRFPSIWCPVGAAFLVPATVSFPSNFCQILVGVMSKMDQQTKSVVSVAEMARMVGLSRQRFYQLLGKTFPFPLYRIATRRPFYTRSDAADLPGSSAAKLRDQWEARAVLFQWIPSKPAEAQSQAKALPKAETVRRLDRRTRCPRTTGQGRASGGSGQATLPQRGGWQGRGPRCFGRCFSTSSVRIRAIRCRDNCPYLPSFGSFSVEFVSHSWR